MHGTTTLTWARSASVGTRPEAELVLHDFGVALQHVLLKGWFAVGAGHSMVCGGREPHAQTTLRVALCQKR